MSTNEFWFARRFPVGHRRQGFAPINAQGYRAFFVFVAGMVGGAVAWAILAVTGGWAGAVAGVLVFIGVTTFVTIWLLRLVALRSDRVHTVEDYKLGRVGRPGGRT